ncbi:MAG: HAD family hydrolase [Candidatus Tantalella remota]|nr:HAD family hydrolase [Candidatus Tantalella remota]
MKKKYVFFDRDGVINKDPGGWTEFGYVSGPEYLQILPGVPETVKKITDAGYKIIIISNQQGVGKGYFTQEDLDRVTASMKDVVESAGGSISGVYYCTHTKEEDCPCRKPKEGLFLKAKEEFGIDSFDGTFYIGDTQRDIQAGRAAGLNTILVTSGKSSKGDAEDWEYKPDHICKDLLEAVDLVISQGS